MWAILALFGKFLFMIPPLLFGDGVAISNARFGCLNFLGRLDSSDWAKIARNAIGVLLNGKTPARFWLAAVRHDSIVSAPQNRCFLKTCMAESCG